jgi:mannosyltransferase
MVAQMQHSRDHSILFFLVLAGAFLRLYTLSFNSLWIDEIYTLTISGLSPGEIWQVSTTTDFMPPLFYWIEHFMLMIGNSEMVLRIVPALFGILLIPVAYLIGKEFADENTGLVMATLFTFSPFLIRYSQEARSYMPALFFVALAFLFYLRRDYYLLGVVAALAFWMHYYSLLFTGILIVLAIIINYKKGFITAALFTALTLPLWLSFPGLLALRTGVGATFGNYGMDLITSTFWQVGGFNVFAVVVLAFLFFAGFMIKIDDGELYEGLLLMGLITIPIWVSVNLSGLVPMVPRYLIFLTIPFYLGIALLAGKLTDRRYVYCFMLVIALMFMPVIIYDTQVQSKEDWRGIGVTLTGLTNDGDVVVLVPDYLQPTLDHYYNSTEDKTAEAGFTTTGDWFIVTDDIYSADKTGTVMAWLDNNTQVVVPGKVRVLKAISSTK